MSLHLKLQETSEVCLSMGKSLRESLFPFTSWTRRRLSVNDAKLRRLVHFSASSLNPPHPWPLSFLTLQLRTYLPPAPVYPSSQLPHPRIPSPRYSGGILFSNPLPHNGHTRRAHSILNGHAPRISSLLPTCNPS